MDHTDIGLKAAIRALADVVAPAVDPAHAQACDQLRLAIDYLGFLAERLDLLPQRDRFEVEHHRSLARSLLPLAPPGSAADALAQAAAHADQVLAAPGAAAAQLRAAAAGLAGAVAALVQQAAGLDEAPRRAIERAVLHGSAARIAFERAWYLPLGLDPDPHEVRALDEFLPTS